MRWTEANAREYFAREVGLWWPENHSARAAGGALIAALNEERAWGHPDQRSLWGELEEQYSLDGEDMDCAADVKDAMVAILKELKERNTKLERMMKMVGEIQSISQALEFVGVAECNDARFVFRPDMKNAPCVKLMLALADLEVTP